MPIRIFIADLSAATVRAAQAAFPETEFEVRVFADGAKAARAIEDGPPDALLTALLLPQLAQRGLQALDARQAPPNDGGIALGQAWVALQHLTGD